MQRPILIIYDAFRLLMMAFVAAFALLAIHIILWPPDLPQHADNIMDEEMAQQDDEFCDKYGPTSNKNAHALCTMELKRIRDQDRDRVYAAAPW